VPYRNKADEAARSRRARARAKENSNPALRPRAKPEEPERKIRRLEGERDELRARLKAETKRADDAEDLRDGVFGLTLEDLSPPAWPRHAISVDAPNNRHKPILFTSDFQFGEVVRPEEIDGMNSFNAEIFAERYDRMIRKAIRWCDAIAEGWGAEYPEGIIYLRGGDAISGEIHAELSDTNDFGAVPAVGELIRYEREGILRLRERFGHVHVISIPGNHGRTTVKPRSKGYVKTNYETILAWWLADSLRDIEGVTCEVPPSGDAYFTAEGWRFLMTHGDRVGAGGGRGFIGAPAPITKGHLKVRLDGYMADQPVDYVLTGHFHTSLKLPRGFANGTIVGYNEYAKSLRLEPDSAKQWLLFAHVNRVYGIELELSDFPRRSAPPNGLVGVPSTRRQL
jgi:hypothetical protein